MTMLPSVLGFTVTYSGKEYAFDKFEKGLENITYPNWRHVIVDNTDDDGSYAELLRSRGYEVYKVNRGNNTREALARSQEFVRRMAVKEGYDYLFSVESDVVPPKNALQRLLADAKDMVGCVYYLGQGDNRIPCVTVPQVSERSGLVGTRMITPEEIPKYVNNGLILVNSCGLGCTLIARCVFENISFNYYPHLRAHSDVFFANDVWKSGRRIYLDSELVCEHYNVPWSSVEDR